MCSSSRASASAWRRSEAPINSSRKKCFRPKVSIQICYRRLPSAGMFTSDRLIKENPQIVRRTLKALLRAHQYMLENRQETIQTLIKWLPQAMDIAEHSYDCELKKLSPDGTTTHEA